MSDRVLIWSPEKGMWWRAERCGYTPNRNEAGVYDRPQAEQIVAGSRGRNGRIEEINKSYLGDGAYVDFDGFALVLTTENGVATTNTIVLEPEVYAALIAYVERLKAGGGCHEERR